MARNGSGRWMTALAASLALHAAALTAFPGDGKPESAPVPRGISVELRRLGDPGGPAEEKGPAAQPSVTEPPAPRPKPPEPPKKKDAPKKAPLPKKPAAKPQPDKTRPPEARSDAAPDPRASAADAGGSTTGSVVSSLPASGGGTGRSGSPTGILGGPGGSEVLDVSRLKVSYRAKPDYPAIARRRREEGTVTLLLTLEGGGVAAVAVEKSSGFPALDEAAVAAVRRWRFENAGRLLARVPVTFRLNAR